MLLLFALLVTAATPRQGSSRSTSLLPKLARRCRACLPRRWTSVHRRRSQAVFTKPSSLHSVFLSSTCLLVSRPVRLLSPEHVVHPPLPCESYCPRLPNALLRTQTSGS